MQKFGVVIHLTNFRGFVNIVGNTISKVLLNFDDFCLMYENSNTVAQGGTFDMMPMTPWLSVDHFYTANMDPETALLIPH